MAKETKDGKAKAPKEPQVEAPSEAAAENGAGGGAKARTAIDDVIAANGRVLAEEVRSDRDVPPFTNSAMDGYAVRAADTMGASELAPVRLAVLGEIRAGLAPPTTVRPATALRIMTGAVMPEGADAV